MAFPRFVTLRVDFYYLLRGRAPQQRVQVRLAGIVFLHANFALCATALWACVAGERAESGYSVASEGEGEKQKERSDVM